MVATEVKEYLENYRDNRMVAEYKRKHGESGSKVVVLYDTINECIENLPDEYSQVIKLYYIHHVSFQTIGEKYFIDRKTASRRRDRAITLIASCLNQL